MQIIKGRFGITYNNDSNNKPFAKYLPYARHRPNRIDGIHSFNPQQSKMRNPTAKVHSEYTTEPGLKPSFRLSALNLSLYFFNSFAMKKHVFFKGYERETLLSNTFLYQENINYYSNN